MSGSDFDNNDINKSQLAMVSISLDDFEGFNMHHFKNLYGLF